MLDERLIGEKFINKSTEMSGTVMFYGVRYHYKLQENVPIGTTLVVVAVTPRYLLVQRYEPKLDY
ncbi:hypothetical protein FHQ08_00345 [Lactobacillus sp. CC-MHH1034]|uniref:hypothetical protein n=1 Tax=Agrilactobacillus fermenti TaxID=2586909 RepID=UPI001E4126F4|nr:hypothetical protein [Agrilactobacillus fermenti]MCD2255157.1 hypothetical protein [Agrilactobacillus fermenti]